METGLGINQLVRKFLLFLRRRGWLRSRTLAKPECPGLVPEEVDHAPGAIPELLAVLPGTLLSQTHCPGCANAQLNAQQLKMNVLQVYFH